MPDRLKEALKALKNRRAGWVTRRDAAQYLGESASAALQQLQAHQADEDIDVRREVERALARARDFRSAAGAEYRAYSLDELLRYVAASEMRAVEATSEGHCITLQTPGDRSQKVYLETFKRDDGAPLYRLFSPCVEAQEDLLRWALKTNMELPLCSVALIRHEGEAWLAIVSLIRTQDATPRLFKTLVKAVGFYADWFEKGLTGEDRC